MNNVMLYAYIIITYMYVYVYVYVYVYLYTSLSLSIYIHRPRIGQALVLFAFGLQGFQGYDFIHSSNRMPGSSNDCSIVFSRLAILRIEGCLNSTL